MPPGSSKGKSKAKEGRRSHSRNTTPSSVVSAAVSVISSQAPASMLLHTVYLEIPINQLSIPNDVSYEEILEKHGGSGGIPDPVHLQAIANDLNTLSNLAITRGSACDGGMRKLSNRRKERIEEERELEQANREAEEMANLKRAAEDDELDRGRKGAKVKKRKDLSSIREERPLTHGAHGVARQDGLGLHGKRKGCRLSVTRLSMLLAVCAFVLHIPNTYICLPSLRASHVPSLSVGSSLSRALICPNSALQLLKSPSCNVFSSTNQTHVLASHGYPPEGNERELC